jgi:hypothetical protein
MPAVEKLSLGWYRMVSGLLIGRGDLSPSIEEGSVEHERKTQDEEPIPDDDLVGKADDDEEFEDVDEAEEDEDEEEGDVEAP